MKNIIKAEGKSCSKNESGATMVEYALLVALIAIALIAVVVVMKTGVSRKFSQVNSALV